MTVEAGSLLMISDQAEAGHIMVKRHLGPFDGRMTVPTLGAHCLAMNVVGLMASEAVRWRFAMFLPGIMAIAAGGIGVLAFQREVGAPMFER